MCSMVEALDRDTGRLSLDMKSWNGSLDVHALNPDTWFSLSFEKVNDRI